MTHVLQVLFLSVFILQVVMHGEESQVPGNFVITFIYYNHAQCHCWWNFFLRGHCNLVALPKQL
jgi:hypothetical protein